MMARYGIPETFIAIVKSFHEGMVARLLGESSPGHARQKQIQCCGNRLCD